MKTKTTRALLAEALYKEHEKLEAGGDRVAALDKLREAASLGAVYAISALAYEYYNSTPLMKQQAVQLYKRAAYKGDYLSAWNLARHYEMEQNVRSYFFWLTKASQSGMVEAAEELDSPFPYLLSRGCELAAIGKREQAEKLLQLAARHGNREAQKMLDRKCTARAEKQGR
jgi:hypothetical protein